MSNNKKSSPQKKQIKGSALLGDVKQEKKRLLIGLAISIVLAVIMFGYVIPHYNASQQPDEPQPDNTTSVVSLKLLGEPELVDDNIMLWFDTRSYLTEGTITFQPMTGYVLSYDNATETFGDVIEQTTLADVGSHSYLWVIPVSDGYSKLDVTIENATQLGVSGFYTKQEGDLIELLSKDLWDAEYELFLSKGSN